MDVILNINYPETINGKCHFDINNKLIIKKFVGSLICQVNVLYEKDKLYENTENIYAIENIVYREKDNLVLSKNECTILFQFKIPIQRLETCDLEHANIMNQIEIQCITDIGTFNFKKLLNLKKRLDLLIDEPCQTSSPFKIYVLFAATSFSMPLSNISKIFYFASEFIMLNVLQFQILYDGSTLMNVSNKNEIYMNVNVAYQNKTPFTVIPTITFYRISHFITSKKIIKSKKVLFFSKGSKINKKCKQIMKTDIGPLLITIKSVNLDILRVNYYLKIAVIVKYKSLKKKYGYLKKVLLN
ncbi:hypothetical protein A3Q56_02666 [Intoshia linei]|uniref:Uncharacterized protein n=1 Tax=Intoshia linei TaxID=1819745 RepID=A0A177B651_9BILA|nr:hypothetical protein A3Q56_02666 [Intoshia linei]